MAFQQIITEIVCEIPPNRMRVVGTALSIVVFHDKCWALDAIIMRLAGHHLAGPGKVDFFEATFLNLFHVYSSQFRTQFMHVTFNQFTQIASLVRIQRLHRLHFLCLCFPWTFSAPTH